MEQLIVLTLVFSALFAFPVGAAIMLVNAYERGRRQPYTGYTGAPWVHFPRRKKISWLVVGVVSALTISASTDASSTALSSDRWSSFAVYRLSVYNAAALRGASAVPDTVEAGMQAARIDLQHGLRRYMVYGLIWRDSPDLRAMEAHGFEILRGGCLFGDTGYTFWGGYNYVMRSAMPAVVQPDYVTARAWFEKAAAQGNAEAQVNLALLYAKGQGGPKDFTKAYMWLNLAEADSTGALQQHSADARDRVASRLTLGQRAEAQRLAHDCQARSFKGC